MNTRLSFGILWEVYLKYTSDVVDARLEWNYITQLYDGPPYLSVALIIYCGSIRDRTTFIVSYFLSENDISNQLFASFDFIVRLGHPFLVRYIADYSFNLQICRCKKRRTIFRILIPNGTWTSTIPMPTAQK